MKKMLLRTISVVLAASAMTGCAADKTVSTQREAPSVTGEFTAEVLSTGKSDAIILTSAAHTVLIDCGEKNDGDKVLEYLSEKGIENVDYLFITHFDKDHVGGVKEVIENIGVGEIITPDYEGSGSEYTDYIAASRSAGIEPVRLTENMSFILDDVLYEVYPPLKSSYVEEDNDFSLAIKVTHGEDTLLFTGDAESERLKEFYSQFDVAADFLKVPHHGRIDDESERFITDVAPRYAVITCSKKEGAEDELLAILDAAGTETYMTRDGAVTCVSSGSGITVTQTPKQ